MCLQEHPPSPSELQAAAEGLTTDPAHLHTLSAELSTVALATGLLTHRQHLLKCDSVNSLQLGICVFCHAVRVNCQFWSSAELSLAELGLADLSLAELSVALGTAVVQPAVSGRNLCTSCKIVNAHIDSLFDSSASLFMLVSAWQSCSMICTMFEAAHAVIVHHIFLSFCLRHACQCASDGGSLLVDSPEGHRRIPRKRKAGVKSAASFTPQQVEARWQAYQAKLARPDMQQLSATRASLPIASYRCALSLPAANNQLLSHSFMHSCTLSLVYSFASSSILWYGSLCVCSLFVDAFVGFVKRSIIRYMSGRSGMSLWWLHV